MVPRVGKPSTASRAGLAFAILAVLAGCGSSARVGLSERASADPDAALRTVSNACSTAVLGALGNIAARVYHEGVSSERTASALSFIARSRPLREAVELGDPRAARAAARALIATGHLTSLRVSSRGQTLVDAGVPDALAPLHGSILGASGAPIASFVTSVWADTGFVAETNGIAESATALRADGHSIAGSFALPAGELPAEGDLTARDVAYRYTSFEATTYPTGGRLRVYLLKPISSIAPLCGPTDTDTIVNTVGRVARLIYTSEGGRHALAQVRRVQHDRPLLRAVARRDPVAAKRAVAGLLNHHIVRLRVSAGGRLLADVGGPYVLAPVHAPLRLGGRSIGSFVLSIQDDEGYKRLAGRLVGLNVLMYMGARLVKNSLGPAPGAVPASGSYRYRGRTFRVFTIHAESFPSGPLRIAVLIPIPYS
jgi:DNA-binding FadR family transcriptional regulator